MVMAAAGECPRCVFRRVSPTMTEHSSPRALSLNSAGPRTHWRSQAASVFDAEDGSSTGTSVPWMWALLRLPRFRGACHADARSLGSSGNADGPIAFATYLALAGISAPDTKRTCRDVRLEFAPCKGGAFPVGASPTTRQPLQGEAIGAVMEVTKWLKPSISVSRIGDSASVQAVTRVNAEQALYGAFEVKHLFHSILHFLHSSFFVRLGIPFLRPDPHTC